LEFAGGLGVLTGETGAGKSILLDALGLALGARADSGLVRSGADKAQVTASFDAPAYVAAFLADNDIDIDSDEPLIIRRSVKADGGSKAFINDQPCSAALLREVGAALVEIHGQHDDRGMLNPRGHRGLLDAFGRSDTATVSANFAAWQDAKSRLDIAREALENAARDREWLEHAVAELAAFHPQPGEEEQLAGERSDMQKGERITEDLKAVLESFDGPKSGLSLIRGAARKLDRLADAHPLLAEALTALDRAVIEASEAEDKLNAAARAIEYEPARLDEIEERLFELRALARKHNIAPDGIIALQEKLTAQLQSIQAGGEGLAVLEAEVAAKHTAYVESASALSAVRNAAAVKLDAAVKNELAPL
jgi:DNA repair protein RecN (Recombination protein N)